MSDTRLEELKLNLNKITPKTENEINMYNTLMILANRLEKLQQENERYKKEKLEVTVWLGTFISVLVELHPETKDTVEQAIEKLKEMSEEALKDGNE